MAAIPRVLRECLQSHLLHNLELKLLDQPESPALPHVGEGDFMAALLAQLQQPAAVARIFIDAVWERPGAHRRPFGGISDPGFAFGVTRIARIAQRPIVVQVCTYDADDVVRVEWGRVSSRRRLTMLPWTS